MLYRLSWLVPIRFRSTYRSEYHDDGVMLDERATWWQWRGRVWRHRRQVLA